MPSVTPFAICGSTAAPHRFPSATSTDEVCRKTSVQGGPSPPRVPRGRQVEISKAMTLVLRHRATDLGLPIRSDGFLPVYEVLRTPRLMDLRCTLEEVCRVVQDSRKGRFALGEVEGVLMIRATQGHSMEGIAEEQLLEPLIAGASDLPTAAVHGTRMRRWQSIKERGLLAGGMRGRPWRNHVHFADGWPMRARCQSGMPSNSEVGIFLDIPASLSRGLRLFRSENGVILTPGFDGAVPAELFAEVIRFKDGRRLWPEHSGGDGNVNSAQRRVPGDSATAVGIVAAGSSAQEAAGSSLVSSPCLAQVPGESPAVATIPTAAGVLPLVPAVVPAAVSSPPTAPRPVTVYTAYSNPRGVPGYLDLSVGDEVVVHYTGVAGEEEGWMYGELCTRSDDVLSRSLGWFPASSVEWRDLRNVVLSYGPDEGEGYLPLMKGQRVIVLYTGFSDDAGWSYGEAAGDCPQRGWFPSMVCDSPLLSRRAAAKAKKSGGRGRGLAAPAGPCS